MSKNPTTTTIIEEFNSGKSILGISKMIGSGRWLVQKVLFDAGLWSPKFRSLNKDGTRTCRVCEQSRDVDDFPQRFAGCWVCSGCASARNHAKQISKLGCSADAYAQMLGDQKGRCAICGKLGSHLSRDGRPARLAVDHDHKSGEIRGLLCMNCNRGLGRFKDSPETLERALAYLRGYRGEE